MANELTPEMKEAVHACWLEATAEVCQLHMASFLERISKEDKGVFSALGSDLQVLIVEIGVTIQNAILQRKLLPDQSISVVQMYCHHVLWSSQPIHYQKHFNNLVNVVWLKLYEYFMEIAQLADKKVITRLSYLTEIN